MSVLTTVGLEESQRRRLPLAVLAYVDHPDGEVYIWSGIGELRYKGQTWLGVGRLVRIVGIGGSKELRVRQLVFELRGIPTEATQVLNNDVTNRVARAWMVGMDKEGQHVNGEAWQVVDGRADYQELSVGDDLNAVVRLMITEPIWSIERAQDLQFTPEWINERYRQGGNRITGLDLISTLENRQESWTRT